jgi:hypothetical protein
VQIGETWAYREKAHPPGWPMQPVEILLVGPPRSKKVRIRFLEGEYPGLDQWVPQVRLRVPWTEAEALLHDERRYDETRQASRDPVSRAVRWAARYASYGYPEPDGFQISYPDDDDPIVEIPNLSEFAQAVGLDSTELLAEPHAFVSSSGMYVAPGAVAIRLAQRVAEVFPDSILTEVAKDERTLQQEAVYGHHFVCPGGQDGFVSPEKCAEWLRDREPGFGVVREWCGVSSVDRFNELQALRDELARLRELIEQAARRFEAPDHPRIAKQLRTDLASLKAQRTARK